MLHREQPTRARESRLNLVSDEDDAMFVTQRTQCLQKFRRCDVEAAFTEHRLDDDCRDSLGLNIVLEEMLERFKARLRADPVKLHGKRCVINIARKRPETNLVRRDLACQRHRHIGTSMEPATEGNHG